MNLRHLPRKRYNRRHSTTGFSSCSGGNKLTNVKSFFSLRSGEGFNLSHKDNSASFLVEKSSMKLSELSSFRRCAKKKIQSRTRSHSRPPITIGSLRCHYGDGKENVTKQLVKISKITTRHVHDAFFVHFFGVTARLRQELLNFTFYRQREHTTTNLSCSF